MNALDLYNELKRMKDYGADLSTLGVLIHHRPGYDPLVEHEDVDVRPETIRINTNGKDLILE